MLATEHLAGRVGPSPSSRCVRLLDRRSDAVPPPGVASAFSRPLPRTPATIPGDDPTRRLAAHRLRRPRRVRVDLPAVVLGICPDAQIIDISHEVHKYAIRDGALALWCAVPYLPIGFHVAVVDPGVGTARLPVAILAGRGDVLIGPDNGLLGGGRAPRRHRRVRELAERAYRLPVVTSIPRARHLRAGRRPPRPGRRVRDARAGDRPGPLVPSPIAGRAGRRRRARTEVVYVDTFGNVKLAALAADSETRSGEPAGRTIPAAVDGRTDRSTCRGGRRSATLEAGDPLLYEDSYGRICLAVNQGSAVAALGLATGTGWSFARR